MEYGNDTVTYQKCNPASQQELAVIGWSNFCDPDQE